MNDRLHALMVAHGALGFIVGLLVGFPFAFLLLRKIPLWPIPGSIDLIAMIQLLLAALCSAPQ
jgi:hypothetical protein